MPLFICHSEQVEIRRAADSSSSPYPEVRPIWLCILRYLGTVLGGTMKRNIVSAKIPAPFHCRGVD